VPAIDKSAGQKTLARRASEDVEIVISVTLVYALNPQEKKVGTVGMNSFLSKKQIKTVMTLTANPLQDSFEPICITDNLDLNFPRNRSGLSLKKQRAEAGNAAELRPFFIGGGFVIPFVPSRILAFPLKQSNRKSDIL
jgi:hypothetical protein